MIKAPKIGFLDVLDLIDQQHDGSVTLLRCFAHGDKQIGEVDDQIAGGVIGREAELQLAKLYFERARERAQRAERGLHIGAGFLHAVETQQDAMQLRRELLR